MNTYYNLFQNKDFSDLKDIIENSKKITFEAKLALQKLIKEKYSDSDLSSNTIQLLNSLTEKDSNEIKSLKFLNYLGIDLFKNNNELTIRKSKSAKRRDFWSIFLSSFMLLFLFISIKYWVEISISGFKLSESISAIIFTVMGITGFKFLIDTIDRIIFYKKLYISKTSEKIILNFKSKNEIKHIELPLSSTLEIQDQDSENIVLLGIKNNSEFLTILEYKNIQTLARETLISLTEKFNTELV